MVSSWKDKGKRRIRAARQSRMAGTWRGWPAAATRAVRGEAKQRGGEGRRLTGGPGEEKSIYFFFFWAVTYPSPILFQFFLSIIVQ